MVLYFQSQLAKQNTLLYHLYLKSSMASSIASFRTGQGQIYCFVIVIILASALLIVFGVKDLTSKYFLKVDAALNPQLASFYLMTNQYSCPSLQAQFNFYKASLSTPIMINYYFKRFVKII